MKRYLPVLVPLFVIALLLQGCEEEYPQTYQYDEEFTVEYDIPTLLKRFDQLNREAKFKNPVLSTAHERANHFGDFQGERLYYHHLGERSKFDTVRVVDQNGDTIPGDPYDLVEKRIVNLDTHYLSPDNYFTYYFWPEKPGGCYEVRALIQLEAQKEKTRINLNKVRVGDCGTDMETDGKSMKAHLLNAFVTRVIEPLKGK